MKPNVKVLYYILKWNGLLPFRVNSQLGIVEKTNGSFYHFIIFGALLQALTMFGCTILLAILSLFPNENMRIVMLKVEIGAQAFKALFIFALNVFYHKDIIQLINASISFKRDTAPLQSLFDDILSSQYIMRFASFFIQLLIMAVTFLISTYTPGSGTVNTFGIVATYSNLNVVIVSSTFVYGGLVTCSRFLRILNNNLESRVSSTKSGKNANGTAISTETTVFDLDRFVICFEKFTSITNTVYRIYGVHILIVLAASSAFTLASLFYGFDVLYQQPFSMQALKDNSRQFLDALTTTAIHVSELYFIITGAHSIRTEIERSFQICFKYAIMENIDLRIRYAVDRLHIALRNNRPRLLVLGLLQIEKSLFLSMTAAIVSFLTILIQFQLECASCKIRPEKSKQPQIA